MLSRVTFSLVSVLAAPQLLIAQKAPTTVSLIERIVVEAAIARSELPSGRSIRIVIDPMIVHGDEAPGGRDVAKREATRQAYLLSSFRAKSLPRRLVLDCAARPCRMTNADLLVTLSEPQVTGDNATATVTTVRPISGGTQYITIKVFMQKKGDVWKVVRVEDLGIS